MLDDATDVTPLSPAPDRILVRVAAGLMVVVAAIYLLQLHTPLRMNTDAIAYLLMAASYSDGHGFQLHHHKAHYPSGYPAIVATLEKFGHANSFGFVAVNELCLAGALLVGVWVVGRCYALPRGWRLAAALMVLLSRSTIRYSAIPGSEFAYLLLSMLCLACLVRSTTGAGQRTAAALGWWVIGLACVVAVWFRTIGVVLLPAAGWALLQIAWQRRREQLPLRDWIVRYQRLLLIGLTAGVIAAAGFGWVVSRTAYFHEGFALLAGHGLINGLRFTLHERLLEVGTILTNFGAPNVGRGPLRLVACGGIGLTLILIALVRRLRAPTPVDVYLLGYVAILLVWPYKADTRFWLPVLLLVYAMLLRELHLLIARGAAWVSTLTYAWWALFLFTGALALVWTTRLSFAGDRFSERYDLAFMRDAYRATSHNGLPYDGEKLNPDLVAMMCRYGEPKLRP